MMKCRRDTTAYIKCSVLVRLGVLTNPCQITMNLYKYLYDNTRQITVADGLVWALCRVGSDWLPLMESGVSALPGGTVIPCVYCNTAWEYKNSAETQIDSLRCKYAVGDMEYSTYLQSEWYGGFISYAEYGVLVQHDL